MTLPIIGFLLSNGLNLLANALLAKGKDYIKGKTGVDLDKSSLSNDDLVTLKKYEMEHEEELLKLRLEDDKLDLEITQAFLADTQSAREREVQVARDPNASPLAKNTPPILALSAVLLTFLLFAAVVFSDFLKRPDIEKQKDILLYILGVFSAISTQIISYYFGSSEGSKRKTEQLDTFIKNRLQK